MTRLSRSVSPFERFGELAPITDAYLTEHTFTASETLTGLAHKYFGDWRMWREIAARNNIVDVRQIEPGTRLLVPKRSVEQGRFARVGE